jgi:hypothetical protein
MEAGLDEDEEGISGHQDQERVNLHDNEDRAITWNGAPHQNEAMDDIHYDHQDDNDAEDNEKRDDIHCDAESVDLDTHIQSRQRRAGSPQVTYPVLEPKLPENQRT